MTLKQMRAATMASMDDGDLEPEEGFVILAAIDRQIAAGRDPDLSRSPLIDLRRLPEPSEVFFEQCARLSRGLAGGRAGGDSHRRPRCRVTQSLTRSRSRVKLTDSKE